MHEVEALLVLPRLRVQNANAISGPITWGFPSPTALCGFTHALHRKLAREFDVRLDGTAIICHRMEPQVSSPNGRRHKVFCLSRNPVDKEGSSASLVEEGRAHLEVSLVIGVSGEALYGGTPPEALAAHAGRLALALRLAGGSILPTLEVGGRARQPFILMLEPGVPLPAGKIRGLAPGFILVSREALLEAHTQSLQTAAPEATALDALLDLTRLNIDPPRADAAPGTREATWHVRKRPGWLVPIPVGFSALTDLQPPGTVKNARDRTVPFRFVEGVTTLGEWLSPHRVTNIEHALWWQAYDEPHDTYRCTTPHYSAQL